MSDPTDLYDLASAILAAVENEFTTSAVDLPVRRYVTGVEAVADCDSLAVAWERIYIGVAGQAEAPAPVTVAVSRVAQLTVTIFRCLQAVPQAEGINLTDAAPPIDALDADARRIMTDAFTLHRGLVKAKRSGDIRGICEALSVGPAEPIVGGGIGGVKVTVHAELS